MVNQSLRPSTQSAFEQQLSAKLNPFSSQATSENTTNPSIDSNGTFPALLMIKNIR